MSNIAGKSYAMNVVTPVAWYKAWFNRFIFWSVTTPLFSSRLKGLVTLSLIHYARWAIVRPGGFPCLDESQPKEKHKYAYMFFFSNFNGSWAQYVDSFHSSIPAGLNLFWARNVKYPKSVPLQPFHNYITYNQVWTNHYYNAYPLAASNDVKSAQKIKKALLEFTVKSKGLTPEAFATEYNNFLNVIQNDLGLMEPTPIVSLSADEVAKRRTAQIVEQLHVKKEAA